MRRPPCPATTTDSDGTRVACIKPRWHWGTILDRAHDSGPGPIRVIWARDFWSAVGPWAPVVRVGEAKPIEWGKP